MNHLITVLFVIFAIVRSPRGDYEAQYEGMSKATITQMEAARGNTVEFVDKRAYEAFAKTNAIQPDPVREAAKREAFATVKRSTATDSEKLDALISILDLDR